MVTNTHIGGKWTWQEALGPLGPTDRPHKGVAHPPSATLSLARSPICGSYSISFSLRWFKSVCINGHDGVVLDPWVHCHGRGALQPTSKPLYLPNFDICRLHNCLWEPTKALRSKCSEIKGRLACLPRRSEAHFHQTDSFLDSMHTSTSGECGASICGSSRSVASKGGEGWSRVSLMWR
jgi:hypothetical protein